MLPVTMSEGTVFLSSTNLNLFIIGKYGVQPSASIITCRCLKMYPIYQQKAYIVIYLIAYISIYAMLIPDFFSLPKTLKIIVLLLKLSLSVSYMMS